MDRSFKGTIIGNYKITSFLGKGNKGEVYKARNLSTDAFAAVKLFLKEAVTDSQVMAEFLKEAQAFQHVTHRNVCQVYDVGETEAVWYIAMEYVPGKDCGRLLRRCKRMAMLDALKIIKDMALGLRAIHAKNLIHGNLKPANIIVNQNGTAKMADGGLRGKEEPSVYMAPEQFQESYKSRPTTDIYALGSIFYQLVTGRRIYEDLTGQQLAEAITQSKPFPTLREVIPEILPQVETVTLKMLAAEPGKRYQSMSELSTDLYKVKPKPDPLLPSLWDNPIFFADSIIQTKTEMMAMPSRRIERVRSGKKIILATAACSLLFVGLLLWLWQLFSHTQDFELQASNVINEAKEIKKRFPIHETPSVLVTLKWNNRRLPHLRLKVAGKDLQAYERLLERKTGKEIYEERLPLTFASKKVGDYEVQFTLASPKQQIQKALPFSLFVPERLLELQAAYLENAGGETKENFEVGENIFLVVKCKMKDNAPRGALGITMAGSIPKQEQSLGQAGPGELRTERLLLKSLPTQPGQHLVTFNLMYGKESTVNELPFRLLPAQGMFQLSSVQALDSGGNAKQKFYYNEVSDVRVIGKIFKVSADNLEITVSGDDIEQSRQTFSGRMLGEINGRIPLKIKNFREKLYTVSVVASLGKEQLTEKCTFELLKPPPEFDIISLNFLNAKKMPTEVFELDEAVTLRVRWKIDKVYDKTKCAIKITGNDNLPKIEKNLGEIDNAGKQQYQTILSFLSPKPGNYSVDVAISLDNVIKNSNASFLVQEQRAAYIKIVPQQEEVKMGKQIKFDAHGYTKNNKLIPTTFVWEATGGSISEDGVYTAGYQAGEYAVKAKAAQSDVEASSTVVIPYPLARIEILPATVRPLKPGDSVQFSTQGYNQLGKQMAFQPQWRAVGGSLTLQGSAYQVKFTAGSEGGQGYIKVIDADTELVSQIPVQIKAMASGWSNEEMPAGLVRGENQKEYVWEKDGSIMVYVPPDATLPQGFYIDKYELTIGLFNRFAQATNYQTTAEAQGFSMVQDGTRWKKAGVSWRYYSQQLSAEHPVVCVTLKDANAYARWAGKRVPTQMEWMKAAGETKYPWGNEDPGTDYCNYAPKWSTRGQDGYEFLAPIGSFAKGVSPFGCMDMAGNVCEWTVEGNIYGGSWCHNAIGCTIAQGLKFPRDCLLKGCNAIGVRMAVSQR